MLVSMRLQGMAHVLGMEIEDWISEVMENDVTRYSSSIWQILCST